MTNYQGMSYELAYIFQPHHPRYVLGECNILIQLVAVLTLTDVRYMLNAFTYTTFVYICNMLVYNCLNITWMAGLVLGQLTYEFFCSHAFIDVIYTMFSNS